MPQVIVLDSHIWFWWINLEHQGKLIENGKWKMENGLEGVCGIQVGVRYSYLSAFAPIPEKRYNDC
jgi:hypothetical protein